MKKLEKLREFADASGMVNVADLPERAMLRLPFRTVDEMWSLPTINAQGEGLFEILLDVNTGRVVPVYA